MNIKFAFDRFGGGACVVGRHTYRVLGTRLGFDAGVELLRSACHRFSLGLLFF